MLDETRKGIHPEELTYDHMIWLVEHALRTDDPAEARGYVDRLENLSRTTGVAVPPWERRQAALLVGPADQPRA